MNAPTPPPADPTLPPLHCVEAEASLMGTLMAYDHCLPEVADFLKPGHFYDGFLRRLYTYMLQLYQAGELPIGFTLLQQLIAEFGEKEVIIHCYAVAGPLIGIKGLARVVIDFAERRRLVEWTDVWKERAEVDHEHKTSDLVAEAVREITNDDVLGDQAQGRCTRFSAGEAARVVVEQIQAIREGTAAKPRQTYCGSKKLEGTIGGFNPGDLVIIAGRPSMGKTTVAQCLALRSAMRGHGVAYFSLEMKGTKLASRALADLAYQTDRPIPYEDIDQTRIDNHQFARLQAAKERLASLPFIIEERAGLSMAQIRIMSQAIAQRLLLSGRRLDIVVVDHLLLLAKDKAYRDKVQAVGELPAQLKQLAKDLDCTVLALSQLSRQSENRENKRPQMSDLRWAGEIEQDADLVMFPFREHYYVQREKPSGYEAKLNLAERLKTCEHRLELIVDKNRHGRIGIVEMFIDMGASHVRDDF
jgi:replicative DNA helicase